MNLLDIAVLVLLAFFLLSGWYKGFVNTLFSLGAYILSVALALLLHPIGSNMITANADLYNMALYYAEGSELVEDVELSRTNIASISSEQLTGIMEDAELPIPMASAITRNVAREAFAQDGIVTLGEYFNQTIVNVFINIVSVLLTFLVIRLLFALVIQMLDYARNGYPVLQSADGLLGGCFGLIRGFLAMFLVFIVVPAILIILPQLGTFIDESFFGSFFYRNNFLLQLIPGT